jgi:hypothetical protein
VEENAPVALVTSTPSGAKTIALLVTATLPIPQCPERSQSLSRMHSRPSAKARKMSQSVRIVSLGIPSERSMDRLIFRNQRKFCFLLSRMCQPRQAIWWWQNDHLCEI